MAQTYNNIEIIVVDDGDDPEMRSTNCGMLAKHAKIKYITTHGLRGACAARNVGAKASSGDFLAFLDDDDEWIYSKTEEMMNKFENDCVMVYCWGFVSKNGSPLSNRSMYHTGLNFEKIVTLSMLLRRDYIGSTSNPILRKSIFWECGGFDEGMPARQDYDLWIRMAQHGYIYGVLKPLFVYHCHELAQITDNERITAEAYCKMWEKYAHLIEVDGASKGEIFDYSFGVR